MITHDNIVFEAKIAVHLLPQMGASEPECVLSYLPLSHVAGMMVDIVCPVVMTACRPSYCTVYFARAYDLKLATIGDRLRAVRPSMFLGVRLCDLIFFVCSLTTHTHTHTTHTGTKSMGENLRKDESNGSQESTYWCKIKTCIMG